MAKLDKTKVKNMVKWGGKIISILSIVFVIIALFKLDFDFSSVKNWPLFILIAIVCSFAKAVTVFMSGTAWKRWLSFFAGKKVDSREGLRVYSKANIGKYLPGNVMHYVERNLFAGGLGISQKKLALSSLMEVGTLALSAVIISLCVSADSLFKALKKIFGQYYIVAFVLFFVMAIFCLSMVFIIIKKKFYYDGFSLFGFVKTFLGNLLLNASVLTILATIMVILFYYMGGRPTFGEAMVIIAGYTVAWVLGFIIPGASGGIGVREMVILLLLTGIMGDLVGVLSVTHRLITIIGDFEAYAFGMIFLKKREKGV